MECIAEEDSHPITWIRILATALADNTPFLISEVDLRMSPLRSILLSGKLGTLRENIEVCDRLV